MFSVVWGFWWAGVLYWIAVIAQGLYVHAMAGAPLPTQAALAGLGWFAGFFVFEVIADVIEWRWTLSAVVTWTKDKMTHDHTRAFNGWAWIPDIVALPIALLILLVAVVLAPGWPGWALGCGLAVPILLGLHKHWMDPTDD